MLVRYNPRSVAQYVRGAKRAAKTGFPAAAAAYAAKKVYGAYKSYYGGNKKKTTVKRTTNTVTVAKKRRRKAKGLKGQVKELQRAVKAEKAIHIHRVRDAGQNLCATTNSSSFLSSTALSCNQVLQLEDALANLKYYNPANPTVLTTAAGASGSFSKDFYFTRSYHKLMVRNNYQVPCSVVLYSFRVKSDTSLSPDTVFTNGLVDVGGLANTNVLAYPTDSLLLTDMFKIDQSVSKVLMPGQQLQIICTNKAFRYDPSLHDGHALQSLGQYGASYFGIRCEGALAHDITTTQVGQIRGGVDWMIDHTYEIHYDAGAALKQYSADITGMEGFNNSGVLSEAPVADNIGYSQT